MLLFYFFNLNSTKRKNFLVYIDNHRKIYEFNRKENFELLLNTYEYKYKINLFVKVQKIIIKIKTVKSI